MRIHEEKFDSILSLNSSWYYSYISYVKENINKFKGNKKSPHRRSISFHHPLFWTLILKLNTRSKIGVRSEIPLPVQPIHIEWLTKVFFFYQSHSLGGSKSIFLPILWALIPHKIDVRRNGNKSNEIELVYSFTRLCLKRKHGTMCKGSHLMKVF